MKIWQCKIGESVSVPNGADVSMREAVARAYKELTGEEPTFVFSGWGAKLTEPERAVVEDRLPTPQPAEPVKVPSDEEIERLADKFDTSGQFEGEPVGFDYFGFAHDLLSRYGQPAASAEPASVSSPGQSDEAFNRWYEAEFKPGMERGPLDKYVARQAWFAALRAPVAPVVQEPTMRVRVTHRDGEVLDPCVEHTSDWFDGLAAGTVLDLYAAPVAAQPQPFGNAGDLPAGVADALARMDALLDSANGLLSVPDSSATVAGSRADLATIRAALAAQPSVPESVIRVLNKLWEAIQGMECIPEWQDVARARADLGLAPAPKEDQS